ncbi:hypothetical protein F7P06_07215 [Klebsiella pneumoniae]|nr:hypothetical protein F7P06_07215 [Klebsiella pneumoniae]
MFIHKSLLVVTGALWKGLRGAGEGAKTIRESGFRGFYLDFMVSTGDCEAGRKFRPSRPEA